MGEWSEYFEDFPEENPANYDKNGRFDPNGRFRKEQSQQELANRRLDEVLRKKGVPQGRPN
ncbi:hypothetical protein [Cupriavidus numazuensis]|uniref:Uncharacterized protein n=1 Tax=Cupriavidus numazuensis TaxID=221992 RepID=A0ABM8TIC2_9BURK|nr:hypothetical protein [Cupriavidus numazuensis]CAG2148295.1 hypothetical protein LMG26411_03298 [Cupriavidus numazuensis]